MSVLRADHLKAACVQVTSGTEIDANLKNAGELVKKACAAGAQFIVLPENVSVIVDAKNRGAQVLYERAFSEEDHPGIPFFSKLAQETKSWIVAGSLAIKLDNEKLANRSYLFSPDGNVIAHYDKIHMFDANLPSGETYRESAFFAPGHQAVLAGTPWGKLGMTICYDMRFPQLYRTLAQAGASLITVPSAFTVPTGKAHWHVLLRSRAIETGCYILAAAQCGAHDGGRRTYGHSLIISPWGEILAEAGEEPGFILADIDINKIAEARNMVGSLQHDRAYGLPS
jgi:predicted amidohydrolase